MQMNNLLLNLNRKKIMESATKSWQKENIYEKLLENSQILRSS